MIRDFDYNTALEVIKASLFDIYESQEQIIGAIEDEGLRQEQINNYIRTKDLASKLIEEINNLYETKKTNVSKVSTEEHSSNDNIKINTTNNEALVDSLIQSPQSNKSVPTDMTSDINQEIESTEIENQIDDSDEMELQLNTEETEENDITDNSDIESDELESEINEEDDNEEAPTEDSAKPLIPLEKDDLTKLASDEISENNENEIENSNQANIDEHRNLFYLDDRNGTKPNFAYVPSVLLETIKKNSITDINAVFPVTNNNQFIKDDLEKPKGIIVRNDQFVKLSLSEHRQKTVLEDAKLYRIEQARVSREQLKQAA